MAAVFCTGIAVGLVLAHGTLSAQSAGGDSDIMSRLDSIAKSQDELISAVKSIKEDLQIVKIRVTQLQ
jgi:hypothetical protein